MTTLALAYAVLGVVMGMEQWLGSALVLAVVLVVGIGKGGVGEIGQWRALPRSSEARLIR